jgi:ketosteroid isomerase-like protein
MSLTLPPAIAAYFAASNAHDPDALPPCFTPQALVLDENREHRGHAAIRAWNEEADRLYTPLAEPLAIQHTPDGAVVRARVSGTFPGSPVELVFAFGLEGDHIARLEITLVETQG